MSSYVSVTIDGMTVFDAQNYYHEWHFRRADRVLLDVNAKEHYDDADWDPNEVKRLYQYRTTSRILRRRLELAGFHWAALQQEFNLQKKQLLEDVDGMISIDPGGREKNANQLLKHLDWKIGLNELPS